ARPPEPTPARCSRSPDTWRDLTSTDRSVFDVARPLPHERSTPHRQAGSPSETQPAPSSATWRNDLLGKDRRPIGKGEGRPATRSGLGTCHVTRSERLLASPAWGKSNGAAPDFRHARSD